MSADPEPDPDAARAYGRAADTPAEFRAHPSDLAVFDPGLVLGYVRRIERILQAAPVTIYAASSCKHPWPWRLQNAAECYPASFWRSQHRILDSGIDAPDLSNADVLATAVQRDATAVVAKDYLHDQRRTTESIREFARLHDPATHPPAYLPLQPPYAEHVAAVAELVDDSHLAHRYMLGGLRDAPVDRQLQGLCRLREQVGPDPTVHGLGWGFPDPMVRLVRKEPALLDSVDTGAPAQTIRNGKLLDKHWRTQPYDRVTGRYQNAVGGAFEFAVLLQTTHRLTTYNEDTDTDVGQRGLDEFGGDFADG